MSGSYRYPDAEAATIRSLTEAELAAQLARHGVRTVSSNGRTWRQGPRGFFEAAHWLARLAADEARPPGLCWGYRASLHERDSASANASLPVHLIGDIGSYDRSALPSDARKDLRRQARRGVRVAQATDVRVFHDQGYDVLLDWAKRLRDARQIPSREEFLRHLERRLVEDDWLLLVGLDGDRMLGYQAAWAVEDTGYLHELRVSADGLAMGMSAALTFAATQVFKRAGTVTRVVSGLHQPELESLTAYKLRLGFPVVQVPARAWLIRPAESLLRYRRPYAYYRLTGRLPATAG
jgi:hypothetical protein